MTESPGSVGNYDYIVPARALHGSTDEMLADIDEALEGLLALRQLIARRKTASSGVAAHHSGVHAGAPVKRPMISRLPVPRIGPVSHQSR